MFEAWQNFKRGKPKTVAIDTFAYQLEENLRILKDEIRNHQYRHGIRGVNGWYGSGQAYTYLYGVFGVQAKVFGKTYRLPIVSGSSAVLLQAQLPNPIWLKGDVALQYNVLGGLVKGRGNFELEFGEQCK